MRLNLPATVKGEISEEEFWSRLRNADAFKKLVNRIDALERRVEDLEEGKKGT